MLIDAIIILALGLIAASSIIVSFNKDAEGLINTISQFQGYIGIVGFGWGVWTIIQVILGLGLLGSWPLWWITWLAIGVIETVLGFIAGFGLIAQYTMKGNEEIEAKAKGILEKLTPYKTTLGIIALAVGGWTLVYDFVLKNILNI